MHVCYACPCVFGIGTRFSQVLLALHQSTLKSNGCWYKCRSGVVVATDRSWKKVLKLRQRCAEGGLTCVRAYRMDSTMAVRPSTSTGKQMFPSKAPDTRLNGYRGGCCLDHSLTSYAALACHHCIIPSHSSLLSLSHESRRFAI